MYTIQELKNAVGSSECWSDVCRMVNVSICTFNFKRIQKLCNEHNIQFTHFEERRKLTFRRNKPSWLDAEVYCKESRFPRHQLRHRILSDKFIEYNCSSCGNEGMWLEKSLTLEVEHINGINDDHRKENLTWLCPNCHSQTTTYRNNKNRRAGSLEAKSGVLITPGS